MADRGSLRLKDLLARFASSAKPAQPTVGARLFDPEKKQTHTTIDLMTAIGSELKEERGFVDAAIVAAANGHTIKASTMWGMFGHTAFPNTYRIFITNEDDLEKFTAALNSSTGLNQYRETDVCWVAARHDAKLKFWGTFVFRTHTTALNDIVTTPIRKSDACLVGLEGTNTTFSGISWHIIACKSPSITSVIKPAESPYLAVWFHATWLLYGRYAITEQVVISAQSVSFKTWPDVAKYLGFPEKLNLDTADKIVGYAMTRGVIRRRR